MNTKSQIYVFNHKLCIRCECWDRIVGVVLRVSGPDEDRYEVVTAGVTLACQEACCLQSKKGVVRLLLTWCLDLLSVLSGVWRRI